MFRSVHSGFVTTAIFLAAALALQGAPGPARASGADALKALVDEAKKEPQVIDGRVTLALIPIVKKANELFNKKFGLDKTIKLVEGSDNTFTTKMMASLDMGGKPKLAFYSTNGGDIPAFITGNYAVKIKDWEALLAAMNPRVRSGEVKPNDISPVGYAGYAFAHSNRLKGVGYNTKLITLKDLPKTYAEMADPKYKGQYAIEPWTSHWEALGAKYYPDDLKKFMGILDAIGKNTYVVGRSHQLVPRMSLGEFKFMTLNAEVVAAFVAKNPGAPLDYYFMNDLTLVETTVIFVPRKSPAPATATLWAMYMANPEVQALRGPTAPNIMYGELAFDKAMRDRLKGKNIWDWQMNASTKAYWKWINAKKNARFRRDIKKAVRQRR